MPTSNNHIPTQWTTEGFMQRYEEILPLCKTYLEAYATTENEHLQAFGRERFKSYDAFRQSRKNMLAKR
ncbi:MAG: hypothetical protein WAZ98_03940 [Cyclobacteriaceae bacterium]